MKMEMMLISPSKTSCKGDNKEKGVGNSLSARTSVKLRQLCRRNFSVIVAILSMDAENYWPYEVSHALSRRRA